MPEDLVTIASGALTVRVHPLGAELWSLRDAQGREFMTDADPAFWSGHAPLLFPIVGALAGDRYRIDGDTFTLPRHGFARRMPFELAARDDDRVTFRLTDSAATCAVYPFAFVLEMAFVVDGATLRMTATVSNPGARPLPFAFGYHPAFAWPLPGGATKAAHRVVFERDEPAALRVLDAASGLVAPEPRATPVKGRELALSPDLFAADALIWDDLASRALSYGADGGSWLDIAFPDTPMLGLWQKPGADYLCIEPWQGHADAVGFAGDFRERPGVVLLPPGEQRHFRMDVTVRAA
ncbi:aldose 1-epimerase family protein [Novosphingobium sp. EMRT-2]|uniref:aldose 1-epimerase family protein n=1 Tax=Novosphingobium sp. EMRT-2 TaxID=2571749 RepID=UPI0010BDC4C6|nr:aldose 1-epimerase family protein [Novosphingobium sp. EMRT-2]QCI93884.1 aldose 1-epimerase family protein [Novosphingobium sp. EMRT-2]